MTMLLEQLEEELKLQDNGNDKAHIVNPPANTHIWVPGMEMPELVKIARNNRLPVKTLCGTVFIPNKDPDDYETCEDCIRIAGELMREMGE
jgi:hypothetical protein